jgi:hypothetical protein
MEPIGTDWYKREQKTTSIIDKERNRILPLPLNERKKGNKKTIMVPEQEQDGRKESGERRGEEEKVLWGPSIAVSTAGMGAPRGFPRGTLRLILSCTSS